MSSIDDQLPDVVIHLTEEELQETEQMRARIYEQTRVLLVGINPATWLDFGCGTGAFLTRNQDIGQGHGYDNDPFALQKAEERGISVFRDWNEVPDVDCIVAVDVVEHMAPAELMEWLQRWHDKIPPGGHLLLATVNPECLTVWCEFWHGPTHVRPYTAACLTGMARTIGFEQESLTMRRMLPRRRISLRFIRKILRGLDILPPMGSEFDRYWLTYTRR